MATLISPQGSARERERMPSRSELTKLYVLIVEDNIINQRVLAHQLRQEGCVVDIVKNGQQALDFLSKTTFAARSSDRSLSLPGKLEEPTKAPLPLSIVLLDLEMPVMDGYSCIKHIRQMEQLGEVIGHVPVVAITANVQAEKMKIALDSGMDLVVKKPLKMPDLLPQMVNLVRRNSEAATVA